MTKQEILVKINYDDPEDWILGYVNSDIEELQKSIVKKFLKSFGESSFDKNIVAWMSLTNIETKLKAPFMLTTFKLDWDKTTVEVTKSKTSDLLVLQKTIKSNDRILSQVKAVKNEIERQLPILKTQKNALKLHMERLQINPNYEKEKYINEHAAEEYEDVMKRYKLWKAAFDVIDTNYMTIEVNYLKNENTWEVVDEW